MDAISQTTFSNAFSWMKMFEYRLKFHWSLFLRVQLTISQSALVQIMAWRRPGDKPLSGPMMVRLPTHICVTRPQWVNSFTPGKCGFHLKLAIFKLISRRDIFGISCEIVLRQMPQNLTNEKSTLVQVMAWCREATSHYLSQCLPELCHHNMVT